MDTNITSIEKKEKIKFTVFDIQTLIQIANIRTKQAVGIRDLRNLDLTIESLEKSLPPGPEFPLLRQVKDGDEPITEEERKTFQESVNTYNSAMGVYVDQEVEVELLVSGLTMLRSRVANFSGFFTDEIARKKVLSLADRLGV